MAPRLRRGRLLRAPEPFALATLYILRGQKGLSFFSVYVLLAYWEKREREARDF